MQNVFLIAIEMRRSNRGVAAHVDILNKEGTRDAG